MHLQLTAIGREMQDYPYRAGIVQTISACRLGQMICLDTAGHECALWSNNGSTLQRRVIGIRLITPNPINAIPVTRSFDIANRKQVTPSPHHCRKGAAELDLTERFFKARPACAR